MPVRLVAADLDGTLVGPDREVSAAVREAIAAVCEAGLPCLAVTARRWFVAAALVRDLGMGPLALVAGGTALREVADGALVDAAELPVAVVRAAVERIAARGLAPMVGVDGAERHLAGPAELDGPAGAHYLRPRPGITPDRTERRPLGELAEPAARVLAMGDEAPVRAAADACAGLPAHVVVQECIVQLPGLPLQWELHVAAADKGDGLRRACARLGVALEDVLAIGDAPSDIPMLDVAGIAVLMGNAPPGLRRPGYVVAPGVTEDGAAWALRHLVLGGAAGSARPARR